MKKTTNLLLVALATFALAGCQDTTQKTEPNSEATTGEQKPISITDMVGRSFEVKPGTYRRIVCIGAGSLRLYSYVGDAKLLSGVEDIENDTLEMRPKMFDMAARPYFLANKETYRTLPSCGVGGPKAQTAEAEKILSCTPDLIISEYEDADKANALAKQTGVPVLTVKYGYKGVFDAHIKKSLELIGTVLGTKEKADKLNAFIASEKAEIEKRTKDLASTKKVYICGLGNWGTTDHLMTAQNYEPFNVANIQNIVTGLVKDGIQKIEAEKLVSWGKDIDTVILDAAAVKNIKMTDQTKTVLESIKAWNAGEVYLQMPYNAYYTNVEIALANTWYSAKVVHPEAFKDLDMSKKMSEITTAFLGKDLAKEIFACKASFGGYQKIDPKTFFLPMK